MARQALKTQASRNVAILQRTHMIALGVHGFHLLLRFTFVRRSFWAYLLLSFPSLLIQFWFERVGRPTYVDGVNGKELKRAGEDLEAKGLTEWMWDVVYWSWGCIVLTTLLGDWAWWFFAVIPLYSAWLAYTTFTGARQGLMGGGSAMPAEGASSGAQSKRQQKMEKRGGQKMQYR
ncbi:hypothetical protein D6D08_07097 [Aureobasidium pullulans]|nr:hypothetical protein D6D08_07097 [Aureobasidium pullulans]